VSKKRHEEEVKIMAKCDICGKGVVFGMKVSHSHRRTNRPFKPNVQKFKVQVDGKPARVHLCTRCLRSLRNDKFVSNISFTLREPKFAAQDAEVEVIEAVEADEAVENVEAVEAAEAIEAQDDEAVEAAE
jgi:large subunit ribosomal protein L28